MSKDTAADRDRDAREFARLMRELQKADPDKRLVIQSLTEACVYAPKDHDNRLTAFMMLSDIAKRAPWALEKAERIANEWIASEEVAA